MASRSMSKHEEIANYVRDRIRSRSLKEGDIIPTEQELARTFVCSRGTVQHALSILVGEGLLLRRRGAGSVVTVPAQTTKRQRVVVAVSDLGNTFVTRFVQTLNLAITDHGGHMVLCSADGRRENDLRFLEQLRGPDVQGLVRFPTWIKSEEETRELIRAQGVRYVVIDDFWTDCWSDNHVVCDERAGINMAVTHLARLGHQRIGFLDLKVDTTRIKAIEAFRRALKNRDLACDESQIVLCAVESEPPWRALRELYAKAGSYPTALVTPYETLAYGAISTLNELGLNVPNDVSVVCLNGAAAKAAQSGMDVTAAVPPTERMVALALKILADDTMDEVTQHYLVKPSFHVGKTSGPAPAR